MNPQFSIEHRLAYRFSILSTLNVRCIASLYNKKFGLTLAGWRILSIIGRYEPIFPGVAAQLSTMDADKVTRAVDRLVDIGYVIRNTDAADRRRVILCLTSRGRSVYEEVEEVSQEMDARWRSVLTAEESRLFGAVMEKLDAQARALFTPEAGEKHFMKEPARRGSAQSAGGKRTAPRAQSGARKKEPAQPATTPQRRKTVSQA
ncbi:MarR family winged helix-turn-helix transcriptional regulator [Hydrogenophaga sp.]|uniref:MarR family winged helix-turn-helix transcriptional regulator n=1 Tax=Hydrogenophaga sp. TaxID=1904254 RepID=UPI003F6FF2A9